MATVNMLILIAVLALSAINASTTSRKLRWVVDDSGCRTPNNGVGNCIPLSQCRTLPSLASHPGKTRDLRKYFCSFKNSVISVCCPNEPVKKFEFRSVNSKTNLLPTDCGIFNSNHRITNGEKAALSEFPWQVALRYNDRSRPFGCAGTLITNKYVLTAAHCTRKFRIVGVRLGEHNFLTNPDCQKERNRVSCAPKHVDINISKRDIVEHGNYVPNEWKNDIALIRLPRQIEFTDSVSPICLPVKEAYIKDLGNLTVIGWGRTENSQPSSILRKAIIPLMNINLCRAVFRNIIDISDNQFCAGGKSGKDACRGDSGGPIMHTVLDDGELKWVQAGIVSFGAKFCGMERVPAMYTKMSAYTDWILHNLKP